jgi:hypothetical protein
MNIKAIIGLIVVLFMIRWNGNDLAEYSMFGLSSPITQIDSSITPVSNPQINFPSKWLYYSHGFLDLKWIKLLSCINLSYCSSSWALLLN